MGINCLKVLIFAILAGLTVHLQASGIANLQVDLATGNILWSGTTPIKYAGTLTTGTTNVGHLGLSASSGTLTLSGSMTPTDVGAVAGYQTITNDPTQTGSQTLPSSAAAYFSTQSQIIESEKDDQWCVKTLDETRANTSTLTPDAELSPWLKPNTFYFLDCKFKCWSQDGSTGGFSYQFSLPVSTDFISVDQYIEATTGGAMNYLYYYQPIDLTTVNGWMSGAGVTKGDIRLLGVISTASWPAQLMSLNWAQGSANSFGAKLFAGSYVHLREISNPYIYANGFLQAISSSTTTVISQGRYDAFPYFCYSPDGLTKMCYYTDDPYYHASNRATAQMRYLYSGSTSWSAAQLIGTKSSTRPGNRGSGGILNVSGSDYFILVTRNDTWPSGGGNVTKMYYRWGTWNGTTLNLQPEMEFPAGYDFSYSAGNPCKAPDGSILVPAYCWLTGGTGASTAGFFRSTDGCKTFSAFQTIQSNATEMQLLTSGSTLYAIVREGPTLYQANDSAGSSWTTGTAMTGLTNYLTCKPGAVIATSGTWSTIFRSGTNGTPISAKTCLATSTNGVAWTVTGTLNTGFFVYADLKSTSTGYEGVYAAETTGTFSFPNPGKTGIYYIHNP